MALWPNEWEWCLVLWGLVLCFGRKCSRCGITFQCRISRCLHWCLRSCRRLPSFVSAPSSRFQCDMQYDIQYDIDIDCELHWISTLLWLIDVGSTRRREGGYNPRIQPATRDATADSSLGTSNGILVSFMNQNATQLTSPLFLDRIGCRRLDRYSTKPKQGCKARQTNGPIPIRPSSYE